jgi:putative chitinase
MKYFTIKELSQSWTATAYKIDNTPSAEIAEHLRLLVSEILDPLREAWGGPIIVSSGYRCEKLNSMIGGSPTSAHRHGWAADIKPGNGDIEGFKAFVARWVDGRKFDQYIDERTDTGNWVHIALYDGRGRQRCQKLKYRNGRYSAL